MKTKNKSELNYREFINKESLFFGQDFIAEIIPDYHLERLFNLEFYHWISQIYWGERLGIDYSLKMMNLAPDLEKREIWYGVYKEEVDHQMRLSDWLLNHNLAPLPPSIMMKKVLNLVNSHDKDTNYEQYSEVIKNGQLFLEENGVMLMRWRINHLKDRSLKSIIYKIQIDEMSHLSSGKKILNELNQDYYSRDTNLFEAYQSLIPFNLLKEVISPDKASEVKLAFKMNKDNLMKRILSSKPYLLDPMFKTFQEVDGYDCFACKPTKHDGLLLEPKVNEDGVWDLLKFNTKFVGLNGLIHGGFISMALDEMMGYAITKHKKIFSFTTDLSIKFLKPVKAQEYYRVVGKILQVKDKIVECEGFIMHEESGEICAKSKATFYLINKDLCSKHLPSLLSHPKTREMILD